MANLPSNTLSLASMNLLIFNVSKSDYLLEEGSTYISSEIGENSPTVINSLETAR